MVPSQLPRRIAEDSQVLFSTIPLPPHPSIAFAKFIPDSEEIQPFKAVDLARQTFVKNARRNKLNLIDSLLPTVSISKGSVSLWVFAIQSSVQDSSGVSGKGKERACNSIELQSLITFEGLQRSHISYFTPSSLYPCSMECAKLSSSCTVCSPSMSPTSSFHGDIPTAGTAATHFPRKSLRNVYSLFLDAVRERLLDDICVPLEEAPSVQPVPGSYRFGYGFLSNIKRVPSQWGFGWERRSQATSLMHTALDIFLSSTCIHIRPIPVITALLPMPLQHIPSSPSSTQQPSGMNTPSNVTSSLTPGIPLVLAPYPTPAFYISTHPASSIPNSLRMQFANALIGLGASFSSPSTNVSNPSLDSMSAESFILVYIPLVNPQGESKGVAALWPGHLTFIDTSPSRIHLTTLPEVSGIEGLLTSPRMGGTSRLSESSGLSFAFSKIKRRSSLRISSPHLSRALRSFRALELVAQKRVPGTPVTGSAKHAAGYVESVVKEREKEREKANQERIRREREMKEAKTPVSTISGQSQSTSKGVRGAPPSEPVNSPAIPSSPPTEPPRPMTAWHSASSEFFVRAAQENVPHNFYPSPPDWNPSSTTEPASTHAPAGSSTVSDALPATGAQLPQSSTAMAQPMPELDMSTRMDLDVDIEMSAMGINLGGMIDVNRDSGLSFGNFTDTFTDDDFNYFDTVPIPDTIPDMVHALCASDTNDVWLSAGLEGAEGSAMNPQGQLITPPSIELSAAPDPAMDIDSFPPAPDLIPSSPARTPSSPGNPPTPSVDFNMPPPTSGRYMFEPIDFGNRHHAADGKYTDAGGKFAVSHIFSPNGSDSVQEEGWKLRYNVATDPRIGVINRLRGIKRKLDKKPFSSRSLHGRIRDEEWASIYTNMEAGDDTESSSSSDTDEMMDEQDVDDVGVDDASCLSHPSCPATPPPPGHPLSSALLYFHMDHSRLLPLGAPMRPSFEEMVSDDLPIAPISVPTPVSPGAALGSASERNKTLEFLAQAVAKEVVENDIWAQAWGAAAESRRSSHPSSLRHEVSQTDLMHVVRLMKLVPDLQVPLPLFKLLEPAYSVMAESPESIAKLELLPSPKISIARAGLVHYMLPSVLRFWEKEGLGPRSGAKNVIAFALFEGDDRAPLVASWLERVSRVYNARGFGTHVPGKADHFVGGLVPVQFETVRKTLPNLLAALPSEPTHIVIYVIAPPMIFSSLESLSLRAIIKSQKCVAKIDGQHDFHQDRVLIHFVPDYCVEDPYVYPETRHVGLAHFVTSVYNRLLRVTMRETSRQFWAYSPPFENRFQVPAFTLARNETPRTQYQWDERPSLNSIDRHTLLHVGYRLSNSRRWLFAACIDERGEAHDIAVWGYDSQPFTWIVSHVWIFIKQFSQQADTEWRIVVSKLGEISEPEVEAWMSHLETMMSTNTGPPLHVSLVCAQNDIPLAFLSPIQTLLPAAPHSGATTLFTDVSSTTYIAFFSQRTPIVSSSLLCPQEFSSFVKPPVSTDYAESVPSSKVAVGILPLGTTALLRDKNQGDVDVLYIHLIYAYKSAKSTLKKTTHEVHADISRNWYDLSVLTRERWRLPEEGLPFHLAALESMSRALDPNTATPDAPNLE